MKIEKLDWDSEFFGRKIGRLIIANENDFDVNQFIHEAEASFDLVYVFSLQKMLSANIVTNAQLSMVDIMVTMSIPFEENKYIGGDYEFRTSLTNEELIRCYEISEQIAVVSRFYTEPLIGEIKTKQLYRKWIDNAINHTFSDGLFLQRVDNEIVGIHLIKTSVEDFTGYFTLTGVDVKYNRMGLGSKLWNQSFAYWANEMKINEIFSPFSFQNKESLNFHLKSGFNKVEDIKYLYHYRKNQIK